MFYWEEFAWRLNEAFGLLFRYEVTAALNREAAYLFCNLFQSLAPPH
jgi:hypothetical protein